MTIARRALLALALAAPFAAGAVDEIDLKTARAEFLKILALFFAGDIAGFLAYGPPKLMSEGAVLGRDALPAFFGTYTNYHGKPDEKPADNDWFARATNEKGPVFIARVVRSVWFEAWSRWTGDDRFIDREEPHPAQYAIRYEHWSVYFEGERIVKLERFAIADLGGVG